ncbi:serine/threonine-protein kinase [Actinomadura sp. 7K507]|uniref:serine/threonine-protein kinase n=1 Tax=Actinomadura sp. 7K507 TaxID=2530365 RepID=UPI0010449604|nr:serine/threonine-protein kinase [Actinomadura sp. 7K507]TDC78667.1 serine/threonine protein kinase [Actinomadura sp. 7K507]
MSGHVLAGRYRLEGRIGSGGMGTVWSAVDETLRRTVAVKEIVFPDVLTPEERRVAAGRAQREARAAALIDHPGVITVHDVVIEDERPWIVIELVSGASLDQVIRRDGPRPPPVAAQIGLEVLDALEAAHAKGIVHRDVKPSNVLLADDGRVVLTDFGIASMEADPALTRTGTFVGSPGYIAPERLREQPGGPESDLWSLAATLYTAVEGRPPFERDSAMAALGAVLADEPAPPRQAGSLSPLLWYLLRKEPSARPDAGEVRRVLRNVAAGRPSGLPGAGFAPRAAPPRAAPPRKGPRRIWIPIAASVAVVAIGGMVAGAVAISASDGEDGSRATADSAPASPAAPRATPSPGASASTSAQLDLCGLLTRKQVSRLFPQGKPQVEEDEKSCGWAASKHGFMISDLHRSTGAPPPQSPAEAHNKYVSTKNAATAGVHYWGWPEIDVDHVKARETGARTVAGIGDEAFTYTSAGLSKSMDISGVVFRVNNTVLEIEHMYERGTASPGEAREAARWIARAVAARS